MPRTLLLEHTIDAPKETLFEVFSDFTKYGQLHPMMTSVKLTGNNTYLVKEKVRLAPFIYIRPQYSALVKADKSTSRISYSAKLPMLRLNIEIQLSQTAAAHATSVREEVNIQGPRLFASILLHFIRVSHTEIYTRLRQNYPAGM